jgi:hypothetical protein
MSFTYDPTTPTGLVRLLIPDRVSPGVLTDEEIAALLIAEFQVPKRAAALGLESIGSDRNLVLQVITTNGLSTNGPAVAKACNDRAKLLREQALIEEAYTEGGSFDYAEQVMGNFSYRERMWNEIMRSEGGATP